MDVVNWVLCEGKGSCGVSTAHKWHIVDNDVYQKALAQTQNEPWCCSECIAPTTAATTLPTHPSVRSNLNLLGSDPFSEYASQEQRDAFFDASSASWMRNKIRVYDENGFCVGFKYKTKRMRSLLSSCPKNKRRRKHKH